MNKYQSIYTLHIPLCIGLAVLIGVSVQPRSTHFRLAGDNWSELVNISDSVGASTFPSITADPSGVVHVVWNEEVAPDEQAILYSRLENGFWSSSIDIISNAVGAPVIASDSLGYLHLLWAGNGGYFYSKAYAPQADSARYWNQPQLLVPADNFLGAYDIAVGEGAAEGMVCIAHAKQIAENSGIYVTCSFDQGNTWRDRKIVYENLSEARLVDKPRLEIKEDGSIFIVWVESNYPETFPPLGLRFASSKDRGETWSIAYPLANGPYDDPEIIIRSNQEIHIVWSGTSTDRFKFHCWSKDDGLTWFPTWRNAEVGGLTGWPALVEDSVTRLHWVMVGDIFSLPESGPRDAMYYSVYNNNIWTPGEEVYQDTVSEQNMKDVSAVVSLGNQLHVAVTSPVRTSEEGYQMDILYLHRTLDSPALPAQPLSEQISIQQTLGATTTPEWVVTSSTRSIAPNIHSSNSSAPGSPSAWTPIVIGVIPIPLVLAAIILARSLRKRG